MIKRVVILSISVYSSKTRFDHLSNNQFWIHQSMSYASPDCSSYSASATAYRALLRLAASQLANFHQPGCINLPTLMIPHLTGAGIGGQLAQIPPSYSLSKLYKKNGTTSVRPALIILFPSRASKVARVDFSSALPSMGVFGWLAKAAIVEISARMCNSRGSWKAVMISSSLTPEKLLGDFRLSRYSWNLAMPGMNMSKQLLVRSYIPNVWSRAQICQ